MIKVRTASRLHFGLLSLASSHANAWLDLNGSPALPRREFGGIGLMVEQPGIALTVARSNKWHTDGPLADRALRFAQAYCKTNFIPDGFHVRIESAAPEHAGFGVGTQLGLAVARAIAELTGQTPRDAVSLAPQVNRGSRSALGVHGFDHGGFLVEGGKVETNSISPLIARYDFPADWHVLLISPKDDSTIHGRHEVDAFSKLSAKPPDEHVTESLCRLVLLSLLPALMERDLETFGDALYDFNRRVGAMFQAAQQGLYANPRIAELVTVVRGFGVRGVGQSSWGPTVFAISDRDRLEKLQTQLATRFDVAMHDLRITCACNHGALVNAS